MPLIDDVTARVIGVGALRDRASARSESGRSALAERQHYGPGDLDVRSIEIGMLEAVEAWWEDADVDRLTAAFEDLPTLSRPLRLLTAGEVLDDVALFELKRFLFHAAAIARAEPPGGLSNDDALPRLSKLLSTVHPGGEQSERFKLSSRLDPDLAEARAERSSIRTALQARRKALEDEVVERHGGSFDVRGRYRAPDDAALDGERLLAHRDGGWRLDDEQLAALETELATAEHRADDIEAAVRTKLSMTLAGASEELEQLHTAAVTVDVRVALVELRRAIDGCWGAPASESAIEAGRHPGLLARLPSGEVQPIDFVLAADRPSVVTGPNMGGKSALLELVGVCQWAAQHAYPVPASGFSFVPVDAIVYVGAEEPGEALAGLSSFGREVRRVVDAIDTATSRTLWLFDEFGRGTHPEEGASLAIDLFGARSEAGDIVLAATHFPAVAAMPDAEHFRIAGLVGREELEGLADEGVDQIESRLRAAMDYRPLPTDPDAADVPRDARLVARLLGLDFD